MLLFLLDGVLFVPALFVTAAVLAVALFWRRMSESYRYFWWTVIVICFLLTFCYTVYALSIPFYSQQDHSPDNPGGPGKWSSLPAVVTILFVVTCLLIPSFPTLFGLAFLPPRNWRISWRIALTALIALYVVVVSLLIYNKHVRYMEDYHQTRNMHLLRKEQEWRLQAPPKRPPPSPPSIRQQQQLQRLRKRIKQREKQEQMEQRQQPLA
jgi:NADH:ubiquinone oxidoreductase subunit 5 (subunit L)/multisubunit Na+/H+ antiporter MnhA subunit